MANPEHVEILKQGVDVWNRWREENPDTGLDLIQADLNGAKLNEAKLRKADLSLAKLRKADLSRADLRVALLRGCDLAGANLSSVNLWGADLSSVNLTEANLTEANLNETNLSEANLIRADLSRAWLGGTNLSRSDLSKAKLSHCRMLNTVLAFTDLSTVKGLDFVQHVGPSEIGIDTIFRSKGKISEEFLRGCGLSDLDIEYSELANPDLTSDQVTDITYKIHDIYRGGGSIQYYSLFISYSKKDEVFAKQLHDDLQDNGVRCWFAHHDIQAGKKIHEQIDRAIQHQDRLLLILSENSMNSEWVGTEIAKARKREKAQNRQILFPISIVEYDKIKEWECFDADVGKDSAKEIREYFIPDFSSWQDEQSYRETFDRLLRDLKATKMEE